MEIDLGEGLVLNMPEEMAKRIVLKHIRDRLGAPAVGPAEVPKVMKRGPYKKRKKGKLKRWAKSEEQFMKDNYGKMTARQIGEHLNRSLKSVMNKASKLRIALGKGITAPRPYITRKKRKGKHIMSAENVFDTLQQGPATVEAVTKRLDLDNTKAMRRRVSSNLWTLKKQNKVYNDQGIWHIIKKVIAPTKAPEFKPAKKRIRKKPYKRLTETEKETIVKEYNMGNRIARIAALINRPHTTISTFLSRYKKGRKDKSKVAVSPETKLPKKFSWMP